MADKIFGESPLNDVNNDLRVDPDGSINVNIQDLTTTPLALYFHQVKGTATTLAADVTIYANTITVTDPAEFAAGDHVGIVCSDCGRFYFGNVLSVAGSVITLDTDLDYEFVIGDVVYSSIKNMNVVGTHANPQVFAIRGIGSMTELEFDITRVCISMVSAAQPDDGKFGGIAALTNGIVLRRKDGDVRNFWNAKDNADLGLLSGIDTVYSARSVPSGSYGTKSRITYAGTEKHGVAVRLGAGDTLELLVQDDLSALTSFEMIAQGHEVNP